MTLWKSGPAGSIPEGNTSKRIRRTIDDGDDDNEEEEEDMEKEMIDNLVKRTVTKHND